MLEMLGNFIILTNNFEKLRMAEHMELLGADYCEHAVFHPGVGVTRYFAVF